MFAAGNKQLATSSYHARIALILTFSQWEKELMVKSGKVYGLYLSLRERAGVRVTGVLM